MVNSLRSLTIEVLFDETDSFLAENTLETHCFYASAEMNSACAI